MIAIDDSIVIAARVLGFAVFALAAIGKLRHRDEFVGIVANHRIVPAAVAAPVAWAIIALEVAAAISLGAGIAPTFGAGIAIALLACFAAAMGVNLLRGRIEIDCGCFQSALRQRLRPLLVVRNVVLIAALAPLLLGSDGAPLTAFGLLNGVAAGVALAALYHAFGELLALQHANEALRRRFS